MISYAQNFEDVMLWRALKDIKNGFYIDIGANHPIEDSVTKWFYDNGWTGINVEPEYKYFELLQKERKRDINLNLAVSSKLDEIELFKSNIRGWSSTNKDTLENLKNKDALEQIVKVKTITLDKIYQNYKLQNVHFLKIDVEGAEKDVLESFSFRKKPWIIVIEATKPTTMIDVSQEWEYILLDNGYLYVYFDGINKYYILKEQKFLKKYFTYPPNVFDEFVDSKIVDLDKRLNQEQNKNKELESKVNIIKDKLSLIKE